MTSRVEHKAGRTIEVDWAGKTMRIVDPVTGDVSKAYLFVAVDRHRRIQHKATARTIHARILTKGGQWP